MTVAEYIDIKARLVSAGYAPEIDWATGVKPCDSADDFACEACWVVLNAGMKEQVARGIWERIRPALQSGQPIDGLFNHKLKVRAIKEIWGNRELMFAMYCGAMDKLAFLQDLPHVGPITKFHLARNLGMDVCKPDRHLVRIAAPETPAALCERLSVATGDRVGVVDCVIWRAANLGWI